MTIKTTTEMSLYCGTVHLFSRHSHKHYNRDPCSDLLKFIADLVAASSANDHVKKTDWLYYTFI